MLKLIKKNTDVDRDLGVSKQVKFESYTLGKSQEGTFIQPIEEYEHDPNEEDAQDEQQYIIATGRQMRNIRPPQRYNSYAEMVSYALSVVETIECQEPFNYHEAITSSDSTQWLIAMNEEIESLHKNQTWELVKPPMKKKIVSCK